MTISNCLRFFIKCKLFKIISNAPLKHESLPTNPTIEICINRINKSLLFKITDGYKQELEKLETMTLFGSSKKLKFSKF